MKQRSRLLHFMSIAMFVLLTCVGHRTSAAELLLNGDFESFSNSLPTNWTVIAGDGSVGPGFKNSPYTSVYSGGTNSAYLSDGTTDVANGTPQLSQNFAAISNGIVNFSFDFRRDDPVNNADNWNVYLGGAGGTFFLIGDSFYLSDASGQNAIAPLAFKGWNHVEMTLNLGTAVYNGSITLQNGSIVTWQNRNFSVSQFNLVAFYDSANSTAQTHINTHLLVDNVSVVSVVPEPSPLACILVGLSICVWLRSRSLGQSA